jgi:hypothetical protein
MNVDSENAKQMKTSDELPFVHEFQRRRMLTWNAVKFWFIAMACGVVGMLLVGDVDLNSTPRQLGLSIFFFTLFAVPIVRIVVVVRATYRCPACGAIPMSGSVSFGPSIYGYDRGVAFSPKTCSACGVRLT